MGNADITFNLLGRIGLQFLKCHGEEGFGEGWTELWIDAQDEPMGELGIALGGQVEIGNQEVVFFDSKTPGIDLLQALNQKLQKPEIDRGTSPPPTMAAETLSEPPHITTDMLGGLGARRTVSGAR